MKTVDSFIVVAIAAGWLAGASMSTSAQPLKLLADDGVAGDAFGYSVSTSGNTAIIGAYRKANNTGAAYLFDVTTGAA